MRVGIIGLPGAGRKSVFRMLTHASATDSARGAQFGVLKVPDPRLEEVGRIHRSRKMTPATIDFVLVPGLVKGESREKIDLAALRPVDVLAHVVHAFQEPSVPHPEGSIDPARDVETVELELTLADLAVVERRLGRLDSDLKKGKKPDQPAELASLARARAALAAGTPLRQVLPEEDRRLLRGYALLTAKPLLLIVNVGEKEAGRRDLAQALGLERWTSESSTRLCFVSARIEAEIAELGPEEAPVFRNELGLAEGAAERIVRSAFELMSMVTFFTAKEEEARAWIVPRGTRAAAAAGAVHTDMEHGFIRAEVVPYPVLVAEGSWSACRDKGLLRLEGKDYLMADGDVVYFRFNP